MSLDIVLTAFSQHGLLIELLTPMTMSISTAR
jgi:hypothetical protein